MTAVRVIYQTRGHKTERVAMEIAKVAGVEATNITEPTSLSGTDLLFVGLGIYGGKPDQNLMDYLDQLPRNQIRGAAIFSTSAFGKDRTELVVNLLEHKGITVYPEHLCLKGAFLGLIARKHPNGEDFEEARAFAKSVIEAFQG